MTCEFCELVQKKENLLYEDNKVVAVIPPRPITNGHIIIISKEHHEDMSQIDDAELQQMFYSASFGATALFENLQAHGTNIICNTGGELSKGSHFHIHVIARKMEDGLNFLWQPKKLPEEEVNDLQTKIKDKCDLIGYEQQKSTNQPPEKKQTKEGGPTDKSDSENIAEKKQETENKKDTEESYLIRQLRRMP